MCVKDDIADLSMAMRGMFVAVHRTCTETSRLSNSVSGLTNDLLCRSIDAERQVEHTLDWSREDSK